METLDTEEPATAGADEETLQTDESDESADEGETSEDGQQEDADNVESLKKQLSDKDKHIVKLESELREKNPKPAKKGKEPVDHDEVTDWKILNADDIKMAGSIYRDEVAFFKSQGIKLSVQVLERALANAKAKKGIKPNAQETQQLESTTPVQGEHRGSLKKKAVPAGVKKLVPDITPEKYAEYTRQIEEEKKALSS